MVNILEMNDIRTIKKILESIKPTGEKGFEGLTGVVLSSLVNMPMRLAASGLQFGIDGKSANLENNISYECKHYSTKINRDVVLSKLFSLTISSTPPDIWVLSATNSISTQLVDEIQLFSDRHGIPVVILDWSEINIPPLAVALAIAQKDVVHFFEKSFPQCNYSSEIKSALGAISKRDDFKDFSDSILSSLKRTTLAMSLAQKANADWLSSSFENKRLANINFSQPLAPNDAESSTIPRPQLNEQVINFVTANDCSSVLCVLGEEGNGKTWLIAQSWLLIKQKPLMVIFKPEEFTSPFVDFNAVELLIAKIIKQTGGSNCERVRKRWQTLLSNRRNVDINPIDIVVVIDGLNQRQNNDWPKIINSFSYELEQLKTKLIITSRTAFYQNFIKDNIQVKTSEVNVTEWNEEDKNIILSKNGIDYSELSPSVASFLCNPRLLGITIKLLNSSDILSLDEISINRLLFEHIALIGQEHSEPYSTNEFYIKLREHAKEVIARVNKQQLDDLDIFEGGLESVADGRFFIPLAEDPTKYTIEGSGLILALGLALIEHLQKAARNDRDLFDAIEMAIEPISALDITAQVLLAAIMIAIVDTRQPDSFAYVLLCNYAKAQNPSNYDLKYFVSYVRQRPVVFTDSILKLYSGKNESANADWIVGVLLYSSQYIEIWGSLSAEIKKWMSMYSLSAERSARLHRSMTAEEQEAELKRSKDKINDLVYGLSEHESDFLSQMHHSEIKFEKLMRIALFLIAGKPVAPFAKSLVQLTFSLNINSTFQSPKKERTELIRFNRIDWVDAKKALLKEIEVFRGQTTSKVGKWTLVGVLNAIGSPLEGCEADRIYDALTKEYDLTGWRRIEEYCSVDPCDPNTNEPKNLFKTGQDYESVDVSKMSISRFPDRESHFITGASTGLARFLPQILIKKYKEFIEDVLQRSNYPARWGFCNICEHTPLFTRNDAIELVSRCENGVSSSTLKELTEKEQWIFTQHHLAIAFPFLSGEEQFEILKTIEPSNILYDVYAQIKPVSSKFFAKYLSAAVRDIDINAQFALLLLASEANTIVPKSSYGDLISLLSSDESLIRAETMKLVVQLNDKNLINKFSLFEWKSNSNDIDLYYENTWGSIALLEAARSGCIREDVAGKSISSRLYGYAAETLSDYGLIEFSKRIDIAINNVLDLNVDNSYPKIDLNVSTNAEKCFSLSQKEDESLDQFEALKQHAEFIKNFDQKQEELRDSYHNFKLSITQQDAGIILDDLSLEGFKRIVDHNPDFGDKWFELIKNAPKSKLIYIHNVIYCLCYALAEKFPHKSIFLLEMDLTGSGVPNITYGREKISLRLRTIWSLPSCDELDDYRFEILDKTTNNYELSQHVFSAEKFNNKQLIERYLIQKESSYHPVDLCRAITVAGYMDTNSFSDKILSKYESYCGFIGEAYKNAQYAYERNVWARYWYNLMCKTNENELFWTYSILFLKIVDIRFSLWENYKLDRDTPAGAFMPCIDRKISSRYDKWKKKRSEKLFNSDIPNDFFVHSMGTLHSKI